MCWTWRGCALPPHTLLLSASCAPITIKQAGNPGVLASDSSEGKQALGWSHKRGTHPMVPCRC
jgi:hypothetical protein